MRHCGSRSRPARSSRLFTATSTAPASPKSTRSSAARRRDEFNGSDANMTTFITDDFLLHGPTARELYREFAAAQPILDYHCHLPVRDIASDRRFATLTDVWLEGDHYKWRAMRTNGVDERYCTGDAPPYEKFLAWARTVPRTLR